MFKTTELLGLKVIMTLFTYCCQDIWGGGGKLALGGISQVPPYETLYPNFFYFSDLYLYPSDAFALPGGTFGQIDRMWLAGVECLGIESSILECQSMGAGNFVPCRFGNASGVWCAGKY